MNTYSYSGALKTICDVDRLFCIFSDEMLNSRIFNELHIDLSSLSFVSPIGAISLLLLLNRLENSFGISITPPKDEHKLVSYMDRIDFFKLCSKNVRNCFEAAYDLNSLSNRYRSNDARKVLLEIKAISNSQDVYDMFDAALNILLSHGMQNIHANKIATIVSGFGDNIIDHSQGQGYGAIQYYPSFNKVLIGIADDGIGIYNSLFPSLGRSDRRRITKESDVIKLAFEGGVSSAGEDTSRGWGLTEVREKSFLNTKGTKFFIRTHQEVYEIQDSDVLCHRKGKYFPGTYILLEISF